MSSKLFHSGRLPCAAAVSIVALLIGLAMTTVVASAHAHLVQADPAPQSIIARVPTTGQFTFDEPVNPALTHVRIADAAGHEVAGSNGRLASGHNGELWLVPLPPLPNGTYSVYWTSESATDGHVMSSFYTFTVAARGAASGSGAVSGAASGSYGVNDSGTTSGLGLGAAPLATVLSHWIGLTASALWLGVLFVDLLVLAPACRARDASARLLAARAVPRIDAIVVIAPLVTALSLCAEVVFFALQGTGGDLAQALSPSVICGILSSGNGHTIIERLLILALGVVLGLIVRARRRDADATVIPSTAAPIVDAPVRRSSRALGIVAPPPSLPRLSLPTERTVPLLLALCALLYMLFVAFAGHAADLSPAVVAYGLDWLHLVGTAAWVGSIGALAWCVLPLRHTLPPEQRVAAVLPALDRYSPIAYGAVLVLSISGAYNALNHIDVPAQLGSTLYGQLIVLKSLLVLLLVALSAEHVFILRPRLERLQKESMAALTTVPARKVVAAGALVTTATAAVHDGLGALAGRLRLEAGIGAIILLATALMSQALPTNTKGSTPIVTPAPATPSSITAEAATGDLRTTLTITPPAVGVATFALRLTNGATALTPADAAVIVTLYQPSQAATRLNLDPTGQGAVFSVKGSLPAQGLWHADVKIRTATSVDYITQPFTFTVGPGAAFVTRAPSSPSTSLTIAPGLIGHANTLTVAGVQGVAVRVLSQSLGMVMGIVPYVAVSDGDGRWRISGLYAPMIGRWKLTVQVQTHTGAPWATARQAVYNVPAQGSFTLLSSSP